MPRCTIRSQIGVGLFCHPCPKFDDTLLQRLSAPVAARFSAFCVMDAHCGLDSELVVAAMKTVTALTHFPPGLLPLIASFLEIDCILVTGGSSGGMASASAVWYSPKTGTWRTDVASMSIARSSPATVTIGGRMMIFGGTHKSQYLTTCEAFDPCTNEWTALSPMPTPRACASAVAWQGRAFIFGGYNGAPNSSSECFDPIANRWYDIAPMANARYHAAAVAVPGRGVLVIGGFNAHAAVRSADLYDPTTNQWTAMPWQLPKPLCAFAAHCIDGVLHILGGFSVDGHQTSDCWSMDLSAAVPIWLSIPPLPPAMSGFASVMSQ